MAARATLKTGDTGRVLEATLTYGDGEPIDLTACEVSMRWRRRGGTAVVLDAAVVPDDDPTTGRVSFSDWSGEGVGDVLEDPGTYQVEFKVVDTSDAQTTVPSEGWLTVEVVAGIPASA